MESIARSLEEKGFCVVPGFLDQKTCAHARAEIERLDQQGQFVAAGVGKGAERRVTDAVRGDRIFWLESGPILEHLESLRLVLNEKLFLGLWELEGHYAIYPEGGFYRPHLDRFQKDDSRAVSVVLYLQSNWSEKDDGGELVLHLQPDPLKISPQEGTLVCFLSDQVLHEVLPANRTRLSFAGWFKRRYTP